MLALNIEGDRAMTSIEILGGAITLTEEGTLLYGDYTNDGGALFKAVSDVLRTKYYESSEKKIIASNDSIRIGEMLVLRKHYPMFGGRLLVGAARQANLHNDIDNGLAFTRARVKGFNTAETSADLHKHCEVIND